MQMAPDPRHQPQVFHLSSGDYSNPCLDVSVIVYTDTLPNFGMSKAKFIYQPRFPSSLPKPAHFQSSTPFCLQRSFIVSSLCSLFSKTTQISRFLYMQYLGAMDHSMI